MKKRNLFISLVLFLSFSLFSISAEDYSWQTVDIGGGGFVSGVYFSPIEQNVAYNRTDVGGAYRWDEVSQRWISLMDWVNIDERGLLGVESLAIDPSIPGTVYMMTGTIYWNQADDGIGKSAFLKSSDYGNTWEKVYVWDDNTKYFNVHGNGMGRGNGERLAVHPTNSNILFYGSRNQGLWKSTNNGDTWSKVSGFPVDTTWNGCGISFVAFDPSNNSRMYAGIYEEQDNIFVSEDGGATWALIPGMPQPTYDGTTIMRLMPQGIAILPDGSAFYLTLGNGAGPHTMQWDEGWGEINDWYNRGALYKYDVAAATWTNVSPENFIDADDTYSDPSVYYGNYSGISIDPNNPDHIVTSSCASYRGPQFWLLDDGSWKDQWGDNVFVSEDGGVTWTPSFRYYWIDGGVTPDAEQMDANGIAWMEGTSTMHWIGSVAIDPFNPSRVMATSGNGVWMTEDIFNYVWSDVDEWGNPNPTYVQSTVWKSVAHGIEEIVPEDVISIPNGPMVSVMLDLGGFIHEDLSVSPPTGVHTVTVAGSDFWLGSTTGLAYAPQSGRLASCAKVREVSTEYNTIPIGPVAWSSDTGATWTIESYTSNPPADLSGGKLALSADGAVTLWMPSSGTVMYRNLNSAWTEVTGINFNGRPVADQVNENVFYCFNKETGDMYVSTDKGVSFSVAGSAGVSNFRNAVAVPGQEGDVWVPIALDDGSGALMRSTNQGATFTAVPGIGYCEAVGFGKAANGASYLTVFAYGKVNGVTGVFRSTDIGQNWVRVNDDNHEYGGLANGEFVVGDMNVFGRVYMSTAGRGIVYGEVLGDPVAVTGVSVSPEADELEVSDSLQLVATVSPSNATNQSVSWSSSNTSVATVSILGIVSAVSPGTAQITVTTNDNNYTAVSSITVIEAQTGLQGDVNGDGTVNIVDALMTAQYYVGLNPAGFNPEVADVNCDGSVTIVDALMIAQYYVGLISDISC